MVRQPKGLSWVDVEHGSKCNTVKYPTWGTVDADSWTTNETRTVNTNIDIALGHTSSSPVELMVLFADSVESWQIPVFVEVPFPRLGITGVLVEDSTGNNDGKTDPDESAQLEIQISNSGGQSANGVVQAS